MHIANPIYDVVFKYLMNDSKIAKLLLSSIIEEEITELDFAPEESVTPLKERSLTVFRLDFAATIKTETGYKKALIEIQKAKFATDIMRFRKYLGYHYQNKENVYEMTIENDSVKKPLPIVTLYFLGYRLATIDNPVIQVKRKYYDGITKEVIESKEEFIESLSHDSYVIQIPLLKKRFKSDLEKILSIFDQSKATSDKHILNIDEHEYPKKLRDVIRRLQTAIAEPQVRKTMDIEDEIVEELQNKERLLEKKDKTIEEKDKTIEESKKTIEEKERTIEEKEKTIEEKERTIEEKDNLLKEKDLLIKRLMEKVKT